MNKKYRYDTKKYPFREMVCDLFSVKNLEQIHQSKPHWVRDDYKKMYIDTENTTDFHNAFYEKLNDNWIELYETYDKFVHEEIWKSVGEKFHYQYLPSFRVQLPDKNQAVHTWHFDSDPLHKHPIGEINVWLPLTECFGNNSMWIESEPFKLDFKPFDGGYGDFWLNNGNVCLHGNKPNDTGQTRMSFDFRLIPLTKYDPNYSTTSANKSSKFIVGEYYKEL